MTRKATKKPAPAKPKAARTAKSTTVKTAKKPAKPQPVTAYVVVRELPSEGTSFTDPELVFATKSSAQKVAEERNRELRQLVNPFNDRSASYLAKNGEKTLNALVKKLHLPAPKKVKSYGQAYTNWDSWWDDHYFDMTDAQRDAIWDALVKFDWYTVKTTTVE